MQNQNLLWKLVFFVVCGLFLLSSCGDPGGGGGETGGLTGLTAAPTVALPAGYDNSAAGIAVSGMVIPERIGEHAVPIGKIYDLSYSGQSEVVFTNGLAKIVYVYDPATLEASGLLPDFFVYYYDADKAAWCNVERVEVDYTNHRIVAYTSHFTPFVLTALPVSTGSIVAPPPAIYVDYPSGIGGSGYADFTVVDQYFKYYKDRDYYIKPLSQSTLNQASFAALGFTGAMGIATYNGGGAYPIPLHKQFTGDDYIVFTAHMDLDVYLMYDTRGGVDRFDLSKDAPWLSAMGFTADITTDDHPVPTRYFVETTDAGGEPYAVYRRSYTNGEVVRLHGNRKGVTDFSIDTNYWLILKRRGVYSNEPATMVCTTAQDVPAPLPVSNLRAYSGRTNITLLWDNPNPPVDHVVIRRSQTAFPLSPVDGVAPTGIELTNTCYRDQGLTPGATYYYSVFSYNDSGIFAPAVTLQYATKLAEVESLAGYVRDGASAPVDKALVRLYNNNYSFLTASDAAGHYAFFNVPAGSYFLVAAKDGYTLFSQTVVIP